MIQNTWIRGSNMPVPEINEMQEFTERRKRTDKAKDPSVALHDQDPKEHVPEKNSTFNISSNTSLTCASPASRSTSSSTSSLPSPPSSTSPSTSPSLSPYFESGKNPRYYRSSPSSSNVNSTHHSPTPNPPTSYSNHPTPPTGPMDLERLLFSYHVQRKSWLWCSI